MFLDRRCTNVFSCWWKQCSGKEESGVQDGDADATKTGGVWFRQGPRRKQRTSANRGNGRRLNKGTVYPGTGGMQGHPKAERNTPGLKS